MKKYNPYLHHRKSIRLKGYDYAQAELYFITICTQNRECLFGEINNYKMILNDAGQMVEKWYFELENKFNDIKCREMIIMPNHTHFIIQNIGKPVGADLCVCPNNTGDRANNELGDHGNNELGDHGNNELGDPANNELGDPANNEMGDPANNELGDPANNELGEHTKNILCEHTNNVWCEHTNNVWCEHTNNVWGEHIGSPLRAIVQWFKTMTTNEYIRGVKNGKYPRFEKRIWQRNYWEHIIRNENEYTRITQYIIDNPKKWQHDELNDGGR